MSEPSVANQPPASNQPSAFNYAPSADTPSAQRPSPTPSDYLQAASTHDGLSAAAGTDSTVDPYRSISSGPNGASDDVGTKLPQIPGYEIEKELGRGGSGSAADWPRFEFVADESGSGSGTAGGSQRGPSARRAG